jgi:hypothetical protein
VPVLAQVVKAALRPLDLQQTKDIETAIAGIRADKLKEKTAADAAKKGAALFYFATLLPLLHPTVPLASAIQTATWRPYPSATRVRKPCIAADCMLASYGALFWFSVCG